MLNWKKSKKIREREAVTANTLTAGIPETKYPIKKHPASDAEDTRIEGPDS